MSRGLLSVIGGALFGMGLGLAGISNPVVINNFLDLASPDLDFTLLILFCVALGTTGLAFQLILRLRKLPILGRGFAIPARRGIDLRLVAGAAIFGVGWSLSGICVGPALSGLSVLYEILLPYLAAVVAGSLLCGLVVKEGDRETDCS